MEVLYPRCAGIDVSKRDAKVCVRLASERGSDEQTVRTYGATAPEIARLRRDLEAAGVQMVVMESTGVYWKPFHSGLEDSDVFEVQLVNAGQSKHYPGRKSDVSDAMWLADLAAHGLLRGSFIPPESIRELRDLTRARIVATQDRTREYSRLEKQLEGASFKLNVVLSSLTTKSARRILDAVVAGERDPELLADLADPRVAASRQELVDALQGRFTAHRVFMIAFHLGNIDTRDRAIADLEERIDQVIEPFRFARDALTTIPGIGADGAASILGEIGIDMSAFPTAKHLASWAGVSPTLNQSAGRKGPTHILPGNKYLKGTLGSAVRSIAASKKSPLATRYKRLKRQIGASKAGVATQRTLLTTIWHMLAEGTVYDDRAARYHHEPDPERDKDRLIRQLRKLGYTVELTPATAA